MYTQFYDNHMFSNFNNLYNFIQFNSMHIVLPWRKHSIHVVLPWREHSIHYVYFIKYLFVVLWHRRKAHHSQPSLSRTHFISILLTLLSGFSNVWDLPVSWSEITGITTELRNAPSTVADLIFHKLQCLFSSVLSFSFHYISFHKSTHYSMIAQQGA